MSLEALRVGKSLSLVNGPRVFAGPVGALRGTLSAAAATLGELLFTGAAETAGTDDEEEEEDDEEAPTPDAGLTTLSLHPLDLDAA